MPTTVESTRETEPMMFSPALWNSTELELIEKHIGENPMAALEGFNPDTKTTQGRRGKRLISETVTDVDLEGLRKTLRYFYDLEQLKETRGIQWGFWPDVDEPEVTGPEAVRKCIESYREFKAEQERRKARNPASARIPSMYYFDNRGNAHWQGPGSDRGRLRRFDMILVPEEDVQTIEDWAGIATHEGKDQEKASGQGGDYQLIWGDNFVECPVEGCNDRQKFDPDSHNARNLAKGRMMRHLGTAKEQVDDHREAKLAISSD